MGLLVILEVRDGVDLVTGWEDSLEGDKKGAERRISKYDLQS